MEQKDPILALFLAHTSLHEAPHRIQIFVRGDRSFRFGEVLLIWDSAEDGGSDGTLGPHTQGEGTHPAAAAGIKDVLTHHAGAGDHAIRGSAARGEAEQPWLRGLQQESRWGSYCNAYVLVAGLTSQPKSYSSCCVPISGCTVSRSDAVGAQDAMEAGQTEKGRPATGVQSTAALWAQ